MVILVYELDYRNPVMYVIPILSILGKLPVVPVSDTGTIAHHSIPLAQHHLDRTRRLQAGWRRWMQDVVCQLVGIGMVP